MQKSKLRMWNAYAKVHFPALVLTVCAMRQRSQCIKPAAFNSLFVFVCLLLLQQKQIAPGHLSNLAAQRFVVLMLYMCRSLKFYMLGQKFGRQYTVF
jgi:hypothetical protein